jgi:hypothetical protein
MAVLRMKLGRQGKLDVAEQSISDNGCCSSLYGNAPSGIQYENISVYFQE